MSAITFLNMEKYMVDSGGDYNAYERGRSGVGGTDDQNNQSWADGRRDQSQADFEKLVGGMGGTPSDSSRISGRGFSGGSSTFFQKVKVGAAFVFIGVPGVYGIGSGAVDSGSGDTLNPFKSGASAFSSTYHFTSDMVDGFTEDGKKNPSHSPGAKSSKVIIGGYFGAVSFVGAVAGSTVTTIATHAVWPAAKFSWNHIISPLLDRIPDVHSDKPSFSPPAAQPKLPKARMKISYRIDRKTFG